MSSETEFSVGPWNDPSLLAKFREAMLIEHNKRRGQHGSGELKLSNKLNSYAEEWALVNAGIEESVHRPNHDLLYGENLHRDFWHSTPVTLMAYLICNDFYNESNLYDFGGGEPSDLVNVNHFTQMVWYDSTEMGVGVAQGESGFIYCVVNYNPRGNVVGEFYANVFPNGTDYIPKEIVNNSDCIPSPVNICTKSPYIDIYRKQLTDQHNIHRKRHGVPFLKNAEFLNEVAQTWAMHLAQQDFVEDIHSCYGENIYKLVTPNQVRYPTPIEVCKSFADEAQGYDYSKEDNGCKTGHYTQMVWKHSSALGIGIQKATSGNVYVVCIYNPPGNQKGAYAWNVFPPISHSRDQISIQVRI